MAMILMSQPGRQTAYSTLMQMDADEAGPMFEGAAFMMQSLTTSSAGQKETGLNLSVSEAIEKSLVDLKQMGCKDEWLAKMRATSHTCMSVADYLQSGHSTILLPEHLREVMGEMKAAASSPQAAHILFSSVTDHLAKLKQTDPVKYKDASIKLFTELLADKSKVLANVVAGLVSSKIDDTDGLKRLSNDDNVNVTTPEGAVDAVILKNGIWSWQ